MDFLGRDWTELAVAWQIQIIQRKDEEILKDIDEKLNGAISLNGVLDNNVIDDARKFFGSFTKNETFKVPLFKGLLAIEDPHTFIKCFRLLLPHMWV
ncbi:hypothetical protein QFZ77_004522 [Paenibacillus sp. V4I3]|uniref:hypothetical protein n=1 Tax=unclassified Paenibacillus TaxID=185978 RepID=UPI00277E9565|nr:MULTISPECIES: hypothetical protein [unclassified Paenibacillus]MDQ0875863.1 hypothetical protein [Paenibacillus sp. V4I3]MDQ0888074.1 hypothetical protein [Paenibacillus sp. V4I9]